MFTANSNNKEHVILVDTQHTALRGAVRLITVAVHKGNTPPFIKTGNVVLEGYFDMGRYRHDDGEVASMQVAIGPVM